jgi:hypothetical protein
MRGLDRRRRRGDGSAAGISRASERPVGKAGGKSLLQLKGAAGSMTAPPAVESSIQQLRGAGQPLAEPIRQPLEEAFGADFGAVRAHTDTQADELNRSMQAKAFTIGQHIFFRQGEYRPACRDGQALLAHELTHVVQQHSSTLDAVIQRQTMEFHPLYKENFETEKDENGFDRRRTVLAGNMPRRRGAPGNP